MKASLFLGLLLVSSPSFAQELTMRGKVEDVQQTQNQFELDGTPAALTSSAFNLNNFVGMQVELTGQWNGSTANPSVHVEAIQVVPELFEIGGGAKIGDDSHFGFIGNPGQGALGFLTTANAFFPYQSGASVVFLDLSQTVHSDFGVIGGAGNLELSFFIPNDTSLIGVEVFGQGALLGGGNGPLVTNPDWKEISD